MTAVQPTFSTGQSSDVSLPVTQSPKALTKPLSSSMREKTQRTWDQFAWEGVKATAKDAAVSFAIGLYVNARETRIFACCAAVFATTQLLCSLGSKKLNEKLNGIPKKYKVDVLAELAAATIITTTCISRREGPEAYLGIFLFGRVFPRLVQEVAFGVAGAGKGLWNALNSENSATRAISLAAEQIKLVDGKANTASSATQEVEWAADRSRQLKGSA